MDQCGICGGIDDCEARYCKAPSNRPTFAMQNDAPMDGRLECCPPPKTIDQCGICGGNDECDMFLHVDFYSGVPDSTVNWTTDAQFRAEINNIIVTYAPSYGAGNVSIVETTKRQEGFLTIVKVRPVAFQLRPAQNTAQTLALVVVASLLLASAVGSVC
jgi:hypothetical protein